MVLLMYLWNKEMKELCNVIYDDWKRKVIDSVKKRVVVVYVDYLIFVNLVWF